MKPQQEMQIQPTLELEVYSKQQNAPPNQRFFLFAEQRVNNYRGGKDRALAFHYLWLTGELMIHHRQGFERVYDFREHIAPPAVDYAAPEEEAEHFFARKTAAFKGLFTAREWLNGFSGYIERRVDQAEAWQWLQTMVQQGELAAVEIEGSKQRWFVLRTDVPVCCFDAQWNLYPNWR